MEPYIVKTAPPLILYLSQKVWNEDTLEWQSGVHVYNHVTDEVLQEAWWVE